MQPSKRQGQERSMRGVRVACAHGNRARPVRRPVDQVLPEYEEVGKVADDEQQRVSVELRAPTAGREGEEGVGGWLGTGQVAGVSAPWQHAWRHGWLLSACCMARQTGHACAGRSSSAPVISCCLPLCNLSIAQGWTLLWQQSLPAPGSCLASGNRPSGRQVCVSRLIFCTARRSTMEVASLTMPSPNTRE